MATIEIMKVTCDECGWEGRSFDLLTAPNPFDSDETVAGCPRCKAVDSILEQCQWDKCRKLATCGTPTDDGYMRVCGDHYRALRA